MRKVQGGGRAALAVMCALALLWAAGCGDSGSNNGTNDNDAAVDGDGTVDGDGNVLGDGQVTPDASGWHDPNCQITYCQGHLYECGDCIDNDGDGRADSQDNDCLGPCDNNEAGFNTNIPGGNSAPCKQDCYFDQDTGSGNDTCEWDHRCDQYQPIELADCNYSHACSNCDCSGWLADQSATCLSFCLPLVPNGCDCFGCCELDVGSGVWQFIGSPDCTLDTPSNCSQCTPVPSCINECGECEICLGRTELPPECTEQVCPDGVQQCGQPGDDPCPVDFYCLTGCCIPVIQ